jgi:anti-anti-sigma factor
MLKVNTKNLESVAILSVCGRIVIGETDSLRTAVQSLGSVRTVILDLAQVNTVDACGLGVLLELREYTQARGIRFELMNLSQCVSRILHVVRLDSVFPVASAVEFFPAGAHQRRAAMPRFASCA